MVLVHVAASGRRPPEAGDNKDEDGFLESFEGASCSVPILPVGSSKETAEPEDNFRVTLVAWTEVDSVRIRRGAADESSSSFFEAEADSGEGTVAVLDADDTVRVRRGTTTSPFFEEGLDLEEADKGEG